MEVCMEIESGIFHLEEGTQIDCTKCRADSDELKDLPRGLVFEIGRHNAFMSMKSADKFRSELIAYLLDKCSIDYASAISQMQQERRL